MSTPQTAAAATRQVKRLVTQAGCSPAWVRTTHCRAHDGSGYVWNSNLCFAGSNEAELAAQALRDNNYRISEHLSGGLLGASIPSAI